MSVILALIAQSPSLWDKGLMCCDHQGSLVVTPVVLRSQKQIKALRTHTANYIKLLAKRSKIMSFVMSDFFPLFVSLGGFD